MSPTTVSRLLFCIALISTSACTHSRRSAPQTWRFDVSGTPDRVVPPKQVAPVAGVYHIPIKGILYARPECHAESADFRLLRARKGMVLQFADSLLQGEGNDPADAWDLFREAVLKLEDNGCLPPDSIQNLSTQVLGAVPLASRTSYAFRYSNYERTGAINLEPDFRLKVVAPLLKPGFQEVKVVQPATPVGGPLSVTVEGLDGYETAYYAVQRKAGGGVEFALSSVEQNRMNVITHPDQPFAFQFPALTEAHFFRLMFLRRASAADRDISLLGARQWALLLDSARRFDTVAGSVDDCNKIQGLTCIAVSKQAAILAEVGIEANGKIVYLPVGGTLLDLLGGVGRNAGGVLQALSAVKLERPWHGRMLPVELDRKNSRSLGLQLLAGDRVTW